jgi:hypothetical protein
VSWLTGAEDGLGYPGSVLREEDDMAALAQALSRATGLRIDVDTLRPILMFCLAGLLLSVLLMISGCDQGASSPDWIPPA